MRDVTIDTGRQVTVESFCLSCTYGGLLMGRPDAAYNEELIQEAIAGCQKIWGKRPIYLVPPKLDLRNPTHPQLPPVMMHAWLTSGPRDPEFDGSQLVVMWFADDCLDRSIASLVVEGAVGVPWEQMATDFLP